MASVAARLLLSVGLWGERPGVSTYGVEQAPEGDASSFEYWDVGDHAIEGACFAEGAQGSPVESGAADDVWNILEGTVAQGGLEYFPGGGSEAAYGAQAEANGRGGWSSWRWRWCDRVGVEMVRWG